MGLVTPRNPVDQGSLKDKIKKEALRLGFCAVGVAPPEALSSREAPLERWIQSGLAGHLDYMNSFSDRHQKLLERIPTVRSILVVAAAYGGAPASDPCPPNSGKIAQYARGRDYHRAIRKRLKQLEHFIRSHVDGSVEILSCVDTGAVQERALAEAAGLGFFGKNTCLILPKGGSYVFLAALLTTVPLVPDQPIRKNCGDCTLCIQACPTQALQKPFELDARCCISSLTIELRGPVEPELRPLVHNWLFGCDVCQEVCPYNRKPAETTWPEFKIGAGAGTHMEVRGLLPLRTREAFLDRFAGTPLVRAKREGIVRNAALVAGNSGDPRLLPALQETLQQDPDPSVREQAAWSIQKIQNLSP